jgi:hypothetical protein
MMILPTKRSRESDGFTAKFFPAFHEELAPRFLKLSIKLKRRKLY